MRRIQVTTTGMALRAVLTALAVYALVLQALFPLSAAVAAANGQTVSICVTTPDPTPAGKNGAAGLGHDCLACCRIMASAALPGPVLSPEPVQLAFFIAANGSPIPAQLVVEPGSGWPPSPRSPPVAEV